MDSEPKVVIVVLNWNGYEDTRECVNSLREISYDNHQILVVDNDSSGSDVTKLRNEFGDSITVFENERNDGYAEGNNIGIRWAMRNSNPQYVLLLNNDTVVAENFLTELVAETEKHDNVAASAPAVLYHDRREKVWSAGLEYESKRQPFLPIYHNKEIDEIPDYPFETDGIYGCAFLLNVANLDDIGLLDPKFFLLHEDIDWCARARNKGYRFFVVPGSRVYHKASQSVNETNPSFMEYYNIRNRILFNYNNYSPIHVPFLILNSIFGDVYYVLRLLLGWEDEPRLGGGDVDRFDLLKATAFGIYDGLLRKDPRFIPE